MKRFYIRRLNGVPLHCICIIGFDDEEFIRVLVEGCEWELEEIPASCAMKTFGNVEWRSFEMRAWPQ
jgi:hypothetical protein